MTDLADFLLARIAEDEVAARSCAEMYPPPWDASDRGWCAYVTADAPHFREVARVDQDQVSRADQPAWLGDALDHVARWDPARVLAECEAKRQILSLHQAWPTLVEQQPELEMASADTPSALAMRLTRRIAWLTQQEYRDRFGEAPPTTPILRALALPYADHPDYRDEWRP